LVIFLVIAGSAGDASVGTGTVSTVREGFATGRTLAIDEKEARITDAAMIGIAAADVTVCDVTIRR
jgi:hypothetical protein